MTAAGRCPKCGHLFELRDGFGDLLPLAYCSSCESYYPERLGECRWCGTKPERPPIAPLVWRGVGATVLVAIVGTVWILRYNEPSQPLGTRTKIDTARSEAVSREPDSAVTAPQPTITATDSASPPVIASVDSMPRDSSAAGSVVSHVARKPLPAISSTRRSSRWVRVVSRHWVVVRAGASRQSRLIASVGPNSRVELGETRGSWRRIRAKGFAGWVEPRSSFYIASSR